MKNMKLYFLLSTVIYVKSQDISTILSNGFNIDEICTRIAEQQLEDICFKQLKVVCKNDVFRNKMLDASSKFPYTGMLVKTRVDFGSYDECVDLDLVSNNTRVLGKHCTASLIVPSTSLLDPDVFDNAYKLSTCLPDQCPAKYLLDLVNLSYVYPLFNDANCSTKYHARFEWFDYIVMIFLALFIATIIISTSYDLYHHYFSKDTPNKLLQAFSVFHNGRKLFKVSSPSKEHIQVIHGLRAISIMWIIAGHTFNIQLVVPVTDMLFVNKFMLHWKSFYVTTAYLGVDTFFFISGLLLAYQYFKTEPTSLRNYFKRVPRFILHRYIRLTPVVGATFILVITIMRYLGDGPMYEILMVPERDKCLKYWWSYFLYVQNYANYQDLCMVHTWYLSADWQLFLVSMLIVVPMTVVANRNFKWIMYEMFVFNILVTFAPILMKYILKDYDNEYESHTRLNVYFIGFMLGAYLRGQRNLKNRINLSNQTVVIIWTCIIGVMLTITLLYKETQLKMLREMDDSYCIYFILLRACWGICLAWVIYACHHGYGGCINWFLTTPLVQILSKLTFCLYITHGLLTFLFAGIARNPMDAGQVSGITSTVMIFACSVMLSTIWTLMFESPVIALEAYLFRK